MMNMIGMKTMLHISFSLAAFVFSIVLYILIRVMGSGEKHKNLTFRTFVVTIIIGNFISILDNIFRDSGLFPTPIPIQLFLLLVVFFANILLTYYMALYMESFFGDFRLKRLFFRINTGLMITGIILSITAYARQFILYDGDAVLTAFPVIFRVILGYVFELYYIFYSLVLFTIFGKTLNARARMTAVFAFVVVIGSILVELLNTVGLGSGILYNYFGAVLGLYIFYIGVETPDYRNLMQTLTDLDNAKRAADEANRSKSDFLANMSHEIRTPINAVLGMNEMILREAEDDSILTYSENIDNAGKTLLGLINDILDFSKIEAGKIEIIPVDYDLSACINDLVGMISTRAEKKGLLLNLDFDRKTPRFLNGDEVRVKQVITNILTNAVKYTEKGSVLFSIGFEKTDEPDSVILNVSVKDTGIGIKSEDLPKLFSEFERIEEKRNRNVEGTGLGMSITKELLGLMGSSLKVNSTYGVGSTFSFSVKQKVTSWDELGDYERSYHEHLSIHRKYHEKFTAPDARILVADDNPLNLMVFKSLIKKTLVNVSTSENGDDAVIMAENEKYDVIFLDHMMPGKDGIETLKEIRGSDGPNKDTPSVCLTANAISGAKEQYIRAGFEDYLSKPIDPSELEDLLLRYIPGDKIHEASPLDGHTTVKKDMPDDKLSLLKDSPIDISQGLKNSADRNSYISILKAFYDTVDERADELESLYAGPDTEGYTIKVHALKSSARIIGDNDLGNKAQALENAGKEKDMDFIRENHADLIRDLLGLKEPLSAVFSDGFCDKPSLPEADPEYLRNIYNDMRNAVEDFDTDKLDTIFRLMSGYSLPPDEEVRWDKIQKAYEQFDYQSILTFIP